MSTAASRLPPGLAPDDPGLAVDRQHMPYVLDAGLGERGRIGLIVLASDFTIEHEFRVMLQVPGLAFYESRIDNDLEITPETLARMEARIPAATAVITPGQRLDVVCYACTSGALVIGPAAVHARIREARPDVACTTPMEAAFTALRALGATRVALIAPYMNAINRRLREHMLASGLRVPVMGSWNLSDDSKVARLSPDTVAHAVLELGAHPEVDAVFVSCTSVRIAEQVERLEAALGKPVTSSNHAAAWHCMRLAGVEDCVAGFGRLMRTPLA